ncbi:hypothetical protein [uncultured Erythrobacter sp.]|nr:hypothetical protein [uncultured Erythrobacter sp.]
MQTSITQSLAACAAILLTITSIGSVVAVPPAHALSATPISVVA